MMSLCLASVGVWVALVAPALLAQCAGTGGVPAPDVGSHVYVVMAYNRPRAVAGAVAALAAAGACSARLTDGPRGPPPGGGAPQWPCVLVTQSAPSAAAPIVGEVRAAAAAAAVDAGWPVWALGHRTTLTAAEDVGAYGSKVRVGARTCSAGARAVQPARTRQAESSRNLLHGMRAGFAAMAAALAPRPHFVVMLEDDVKIGAGPVACAGGRARGRTTRVGGGWGGRRLRHARVFRLRAPWPRGPGRRGRGADGGPRARCVACTGRERRR